MSIPTRTEILDDIYTSTWNNRRKEVVDQIFDATPTLNEFKRRKAIKFDGQGGRYLEVPLSYGKNETVSSFGAGSTISLSDTKILTVAQYLWKFVHGTIVRYFVDDARNKSVQKHIDLANAKVDNLRDSLADKFEEYIFGDGSGNGGLDPEGLGNLVPSDPTTGVVGNIDRSTNTWWRNRTLTAGGPATTNLVKDMRRLANTCSEGKTRMLPDLIVTTQEVAEAYDEEVLELRQIVRASEGDVEPTTTTWKGREIIWSSKCPANTMYMLNTRYISFVVDPDYNFTPTEWKSFQTQHDRAMSIIWKGNLVVSRMKSLGIMVSIQP